MILVKVFIKKWTFFNGIKAGQNLDRIWEHGIDADSDSYYVWYGIHWEGHGENIFGFFSISVVTNRGKYHEQTNWEYCGMIEDTHIPLGVNGFWLYI